MSEFPSIRSFLSTYFPVFMGAIFASIFTLVFAVPQFFDSYLPAFPWRTTPSIPSWEA